MVRRPGSRLLAVTREFGGFGPNFGFRAFQRLLTNAYRACEHHSLLGFPLLFISVRSLHRADSHRKGSGAHGDLGH